MRILSDFERIRVSRSECGGEISCGDVTHSPIEFLSQVTLQCR